MIAANLKPKECWTKPVPIFVIFLDSNKLQNLPDLLIQELKINWRIYSRKADKLSKQTNINSHLQESPFGKGGFDLSQNPP